MDQHFEYYDFGKNHAPRKVIKSGYKKEVKSATNVSMAALLNTGNLKIHLKTHSGEKSIVCNQCDCQFYAFTHSAVEKSQVNVASVTLHRLMQTP